MLQTVRYFTIHPSHLKKYNHLILQNWNLLLETSCFMLHMLNLDGIDMMCDLQFLFMRTMCWSDIMFLEQDYLLIMLKTEKISI